MTIPWRGIFAVFGGILLQLTLGTVYIYGNINAYLISFMRSFGTDPDISMKMAPYIFSLQVTAHSSTVWLGGLIEKRMGPVFTSLLGGWIFSMSSLWTGVSCKSYYVVLFTYGILNGIGSGLSYGVSMAVGMRYFPKYKGLINGLILSGYGFGAFLFNPLAIYIVNPDNYQLPEGQQYYPPEYVTHVPTMFFILGCIYAGAQFCGAMLLRNPKVKEITTAEEGYTQEDVTHGLDLKQTLHTRQFYFLWCVAFCNSIAVNLFSSFWKNVGKDRVTQNESFLVWAGSISSLFNAAARPFWGAVSDKLGFKIVMGIIACSMVGLSASFYFIRNETVYMIYVSAIYFCIGGNFALIPTEVSTGFGQKNFGLIYGLVLTAQIISSNTASFLSQILFDAIGYQGLFFIVAGFAGISATIVIVFYHTKDWRLTIFGPDKTESNRQSKTSFLQLEENNFNVQEGSLIINK